MRFTEFEAIARQEWQRIPDRFKAGIDALVVKRDAHAHPGRSGIWTLGECVTELYPSEFGGPDTTRSAVVLYYGSFRRLAEDDAAFDWQAEIWETLTHELRHHLESLAAEDALDDVDAGMEQNFRRADGESFDPFFFRLGEPAPGGWYRLEDSFFLELEPDGNEVEFEWRGRRYRVMIPAAGEDVVFLTIERGVADAPAELCLVLVRPLGLGARLRSALKGGLRVAEHAAMAVPA